MKKVLQSYPCLTYGVFVTIFWVIIVAIFRDYEYLGDATFALLGWIPTMVIIPISAFMLWLPLSIVCHFFGDIPKFIAIIVSVSAGLIICYIIDTIIRKLLFLKTIVVVLIALLFIVLAIPFYSLWVLAVLYDLLCIVISVIKIDNHDWPFIFGAVYIIVMLSAFIYFGLKWQIIDRLIKSICKNAPDENSVPK